MCMPWRDVLLLDSCVWCFACMALCESLILLDANHFFTSANGVGRRSCFHPRLPLCVCLLAGSLKKLWICLDETTRQGTVD